MFKGEICNQGEVVPETLLALARTKARVSFFYLGQEVQNELGQFGRNFSLGCLIFCFHLPLLFIAPAAFDPLFLSA